jgi:acetyl esterase/lipase
MRLSPPLVPRHPALHALGLLLLLSPMGVRAQPDDSPAARRLREADRDGDGLISRAEFPGPPALFGRLDRNRDDQLDQPEFAAGLEQAARNRPDGPHRAARVPEGTVVHRDLAYCSAGHPRQTLDLYVPHGATNAPLVVWIHGGAWQAGSKDNCRALPLLQHGYAVASLNYRLSQHARFPAQIEDCKAALRWLRVHGREHGVATDRIGVWGASAGGHLVALLGTSGDVSEFDVGEHTNVSSRVQAVCNWFGPSDFAVMDQQAGDTGRMRHNATDSPEAKLLGGPPEEKPKLAAKASPVTYVTADDPPFLHLHGDRDPLVPVGQSRLLHETLSKAGVESELLILEGAGHGGPEFESPEVKAKIVALFDRHLKPSAR